MPAKNYAAEFLPTSRHDRDEAIEAWAAEPRTTRGGQPWYSALAILTALTLRAVFHLAYRTIRPLAAVPRRWRCHSRGRMLAVVATPSPCIFLWTARVSSCVARASGWPRSTARASAAHGESSISAWMPTRAGSWPRR